MADTDQVYLVLRVQGTKIKNVFGAYESEQVAQQVVEEIVDEEVNRYDDPGKQEKAEKQVRKRLKVESLNVRSNPIY